MSFATLYIAGTGVVTPVGATTAMTAAAVNAEVSAYARSRFVNKKEEFITMAMVPDLLFEEMRVEIDEFGGYAEQHDHIIKMAIQAIYESCARSGIEQPIPLLLAMPEQEPLIETIPAAELIKNLAKNCPAWVSARLTRCIPSGRAAGMEAIEYLFAHHEATAARDFILIGGSDAYGITGRLLDLDDADRLLAPNSSDGFAPAEGAGFLLMTPRPELALQRDGCVIAVHRPGLADEPGHWYSQEHCRGDGLDHAFKGALANHQQQDIGRLYSSMNGEHYWAKELGVAQIRNRSAFREDVKVIHPADCFGDLGAATAPVLIALAAEHLLSDASSQAHLIYSSSDGSRRAAIVLEKLGETAALDRRVS